MPVLSIELPGRQRLVLTVRVVLVSDSAFCVHTVMCTRHRVRRRHDSLRPRSGELRTQKLKSHLVRTLSLNVLPFKPGVGQYIAIHATLTAREFFLDYFYPSSPFTCIFFQNLSQFFPVLACRIKEVTLLDAGSLVECPRHINRLKKHDLWKDDDL